MSSWVSSRRLYRRWCAKVACHCLRSSLVALPVVQVFEVFYKVVEVILLDIARRQFVLKLLLPALQLLVGCRVGVAVRASPLQ